MPGSFCVYWIDDKLDPNAPPSYHFPSMKFDHPVRFAWTMQGDPSQYGVAAASDTMTVYPYGGGTPGPYSVTGDTVVGGVPVTLGYGEFAAEPVSTPEKPEAQLDKILSAPPGGGGCLQRALVIDGGDKKSFLSSGIASAAAADGNLINTWLTNRGFTVTRISQYWSNPAPAYPDGMQRNRFYADITAVVNLFANTPVGANCHHEFFLYVSSHGTRNSEFSLYDPAGGGGRQRVSYADTFTRLNAFPTDAQHLTTVYTMHDACHAGLAVPAAQANFSVPPANPAHLALQVLTSSDAQNESAAGHTIFGDSATEDFIEDPATMTSGFAVMVNDANGRNPQRLRAPDQAGAARYVLDP
jgi:hypothetical protein